LPLEGWLDPRLQLLDIPNAAANTAPNAIAEPNLAFLDDQDSAKFSLFHQSFDLFHDFMV
jgi:hypothetical protein